MVTKKVTYHEVASGSMSKSEDDAMELAGSFHFTTLFYLGGNFFAK